MTNAAHDTAIYTPTGVGRYSGNPFIEALPALPMTKKELLTCTANYPELPSAAVRRASEVVRMAELRAISDLRMALPEYHRTSTALMIALREPYVPRNPTTLADVRRRHEIVMAGNWEGFNSALQLTESRAMGYTIIAQTGMGKTTYMLSFLRNYPQIIYHKEYKGKPLICVQITYLILRCPHDGTLKSLCLQFFEQIDQNLGTRYLKQAIGLRGIAPMVMLMETVAVQVSLGLLVIDELQNLRVAKGARAELMLSLFSDILEKVGVSLLILATPAVQPVLEAGVRNMRKLTTSGDLVVYPVRSGSKQWNTYTDVYWEYGYTKKHVKLTSSIRRAWYDASGGNYGFAAVAYYLAQMDAIGGTEVVDEVAFRRVASNQMAFLQPAVAALKSGNPADLLRFDDLVLHKPYEQLRLLVGPAVQKTNAYRGQRFEEEVEKQMKVAAQHDRKPGLRRGQGAHPRGGSASSLGTLRRENPLRS